MFLAKVPGKYSTWTIISLPCHYSWNPQFPMQCPAQRRLSMIVHWINKPMKWMIFLKMPPPIRHTKRHSHVPEVCRDPSKEVLWSKGDAQRTKALKGGGTLLLKALKNRERPLLWNAVLPVREEWIHSYWLPCKHQSSCMEGRKGKWDIQAPRPHRQPRGRHRKTCNYSVVGWCCRRCHSAREKGTWNRCRKAGNASWKKWHPD